MYKQELDIQVIKNDKAKVYEYYYSSICNVCKALNKKYNYNDLDDLLSYAYIVINNLCDNYDASKNQFGAYFHIFFPKEMNSYAKRQYRKRLKCIDTECAELYQYPTYDSYNIFDEELFNIINMFPDNYKTMIKMLLQDKNENDIANSLNISQSRVNQMKQIIKQKQYKVNAANGSLQEAIEALRKYFNKGVI